MWNLENMYVSGQYLGDYPVSGKVYLSRVEYGGGVSHYVDLDTPVAVFGSIRESVVLKHSEIQRVADNKFN